MELNRMDYDAYDDIIAWENILDELEDDEEKLLRLKKYIERREQEIINTVDFNKLYGKNNDKIRKYHVQKVLKNTVNDKDNLELKINQNKREIEFLKATVAVKIEYMRLRE